MSASSYLPQSTVIWAAQGKVATLTCSRCGHSFEPHTWQPRMRCPNCHMLGYPDRAGRNLLMLDWQCPVCDTFNPASQNFCTSCSSGLSTRCLRCEQPVYTAICDHCGAPQSRLAHLITRETRRDTWVPLLREHIREQQSQQRSEPTVSAVDNPASPVRSDPTYGVQEWRRIDAEMRAAAEARRQRHARKRRSGRRIWGWIVVLAGISLLILFNGQELRDYLLQTGVLEEISRVSAVGWGWLHARLFPLVSLGEIILGYWWTQFMISLKGSPSLDDTGYAMIFATVVFGLALLPALLYMLGRLVQRLFP